MYCSPPDSSVHGIFQARILEWVAISFSRGSSRPRDRTHWQVDSLPLSHLGRVYYTYLTSCLSVDIYRLHWGVLKISFGGWFVFVVAYIRIKSMPFWLSHQEGISRSSKKNVHIFGWIRLYPRDSLVNMLWLIWWLFENFTERALSLLACVQEVFASDRMLSCSSCYEMSAKSNRGRAEPGCNSFINTSTQNGSQIILPRGLQSISVKISSFSSFGIASSLPQLAFRVDALHFPLLTLFAERHTVPLCTFSWWSSLEKG